MSAALYYSMKCHSSQFWVIVRDCTVTFWTLFSCNLWLWLILALFLSSFVYYKPCESFPQSCLLTTLAPTAWRTCHRRNSTTSSSYTRLKWVPPPPLLLLDSVGIIPISLAPQYNHPSWWGRHHFINWFKSLTDSTKWNCVICLASICAIIIMVTDISSQLPIYMNIVDIIYNIVYSVYVLGNAYNDYRKREYIPMSWSSRCKWFHVFENFCISFAISDRQSSITVKDRTQVV